MTNKESYRGNLYEKGFNLGILDYLKNYAKNGKELTNFVFQEYVEVYENRALLNNKEAIISKYKEDCVNDNLDSEALSYIIYSGFLNGKSTIRKIFYTCTGNDLSFNINSYKDDEIFKDIVEVVLFHGNLYQFIVDSRDEIIARTNYEMILKQLENYLRKNGGLDNFINSIPQYMDLAKETLTQKGHFLNADTIILLKIKDIETDKDRFYPVFFDVSMNAGDVYCNINSAIDQVKLFSKHLQNKMFGLMLKDANVIPDIKGTPLDMKVVSEYAVKEKETRKLIQAGSYAYSFLKFLKNRKFFKTNKLGQFIDIDYVTIIGTTNDDDAVINVEKPTLAALEPFFDAYNSMAEYGLEPLKKQYKKLENALLEHSFKKEQEDGWTTFSKKMTGFNNTIEVRKKHSEKILQALNDPSVDIIYLFGSPGIGKTYSIAEKYSKEKRTAMFYMSSRKMVNQDFITKFENPKEGDANYVILYRDSKMEDNEVKVSCVDKAYKTLQNIGKDLPIKYSYSPEEKISTIMEKLSSQTKTEARFNRSGNYTGVYKTSCMAGAGVTGVHYKNETDELSNILTIFTTQACSNVPQNELLNGIKQFFNLDDNLNENLKKVKNKYDSIVFIVDEISGDEEGIYVGNAFKRILYTLKRILLPSIDIKLIIADASMQTKEIINYYSKASHIKEAFHIGDNNESDEICSYEEEVLKSYKVAYINTNCFPAKAINVSYKHLYYGDLNQKSHLELKDKLLKDAQNILESGQEKQIIVFLQNKVFIDELSQNLNFLGINNEKITSSISETKKEEILEKLRNPQSGIRVMLITSTASRGISFPFVTDILTVIPNFKLASNFMEIMQGVFRARGNDNRSLNEETNLTFYLANDVESISRGKRVEQNALNDIKQVDKNMDMLKLKSRADLLSLTCLNQGCLETRIYGYDFISNKKIVPLGSQGFSFNYSNPLIELNKSVELIRNLGVGHGLQEAQLWEFCDMVTSGGVSISSINHEKISAFIRNIDNRIHKLFDTSSNVKNELPFLLIDDCLVFPLSHFTTSTVANSYNWKNAKSRFEELSKSVRSVVYARGEEKYIDAYKNMISFAKESFSLFDNKFNVSKSTMNNDFYIAIPLHCLGKSWAKEGLSNWSKLVDDDNLIIDIDIIEQMSSLISLNAEVGNTIPLNARYSFQEYPYMVFTSSDLCLVSALKYKKTQIITSSRLNMLSLLFSEKNGQVFSNNV